MNEVANIQVIKDIYAAFGRRDMPFIMNAISDKLDMWGIQSDTDTGVPWHLKIRSKGDVPKFFEALAKTVDHTVFIPKDFAAGGDEVYCTLHMEQVVLATGQKLVSDVVHKFTLRDGKIVAWNGFEDTAKSQALFRR